ncbi:hypothetical protein GF342_03450 [Candidatus Woesearchaeota archaeon]|nr:hypothetical protein [Candidatus Woesearchaeota archaeon]
MAEKTKVADGETIEYEGIFKLAKFVQSIKEWLEEKGYGWIEKDHLETIGPEGKYIEAKIEGEKKAADYAKQILKIKLTFENIKDKIVDFHGEKSRYAVGKAKIKIDAHVKTDFEKRWKEDKPAFYLLRLFFEKHIYSPYSKRLEDTVREDVNALKDHISNYLNLYKY